MSRIEAMHSLGASSLAAVSITNEIEIRIRGLRYPNNHSEYSSPIPNSPLKIRRKLRFFFQTEKIVQS